MRPSRRVLCDNEIRVVSSKGRSFKSASYQDKPQIDVQITTMNETRDLDPRPRATTMRISPPVQYAIIAVVALVSAILVLKLWTVDLSIPLYYLARRDTLTADSFMKGMLENGWFYQNDKLGAPLGSIAYDYPVFSLAHETLIRAILFAVPNPGFALNLFFVLGFPLTAITAYFVLRRLNIATMPAAVTSVLYAFLPYRFWRNTSHLFYSSFYFVPLAVLVTLWVVRGESLFEFSLGLRRRPVVRITKNGWLALLFCALISWDNQYHAFLRCCSCSAPRASRSRETVRSDTFGRRSCSSARFSSAFSSTSFRTSSTTSNMRLDLRPRSYDFRKKRKSTH